MNAGYNGQYTAPVGQDLMAQYYQQMQGGIQGQQDQQLSLVEQLQQQRLQQQGSWQSKLFGNNSQMGLLTGGAKAVGGLMGAYNGYQSNQLAKKQMGITRGAMNRDIANQAKLTNNSLEQRYRASLASNGVYGTAGDTQTKAYMDKNSIDGSAI